MKTVFLPLCSLLLAFAVTCPGSAQPDGEPLDLSSLLSLFSAHALPDGGVRLNWVLEKQSPLIQVFRIYRGYEDFGNFEVLAELPSQGISGGMEYSYVDTAAYGGVSYFYKLSAAGQRAESIFPVVISATAQMPAQGSVDLERLPVMVLPGERLTLYVRHPGRVSVDVLTTPVKSLVDDSLRPGIFELNSPASATPVTLRVRHESGYTAEVIWPLRQSPGR